MGVSRLPRSAVTGLVISGFLLSGCASWINPHVGNEVPRPSYAQTDAKSLKISFAGGAGEAINYANGWRDAYYKAVGEQSMLRNGIAFAVIPASATALFVGITGDSRRSKDAITALAVGAAGLLGLGTFLESSDRQLVYLAGHQALGCVILASRALLIDQDSFNVFVQALEELRNGTKINALREAREEVAKLSTETGISASLKNEADQQVKDADNLLGSIDEVRKNGIRLKAKIDRAGPEVVASVDNIVAAVSVQIVKTEPDIAAITGLTVGFESTAGRIATLPKFDEAGADKDEKAELLGDDSPEVERRLRTAIVNLRSKAGALARTINTVGARTEEYLELQKTVGKIEDCNVAEVVTGLTITPPEGTAELEPGQTYSIVITGGKRPYSAQLVGMANVAGVKLERSGFDQVPVVATITTSKTETKDGTFSLVVADATGDAPYLIRFTIKPAESDPPPEENRVELPEFELQMSEPQKRIAQYGAGLRGDAVDGKIGEKSRKEIKAFQESQNLPTKTGAIDEETYKRLVPLVEAEWANAVGSLKCPLESTLNAFECAQLSKETLETIQKAKLGIDSPTGLLDAATRTALAAETWPDADAKPANQLTAARLQKLQENGP